MTSSETSKPRWRKLLRRLAFWSRSSARDAAWKLSRIRAEQEELARRIELYRTIREAHRHSGGRT